LNKDVNRWEQKQFTFAGKLEVQILIKPGRQQQVYTLHNHSKSLRNIPLNPRSLLTKTATEGINKTAFKGFGKLKKFKETNGTHQAAAACNSFS